MPQTKAQRSAAQHAYRLRTLYGITAEEYKEIHLAQGGVCAMCKRATGKTKRLAVDHDHKTGLIRGLLCSTCNKINGHFRDDPQSFQDAMYYLMSPPAQAVIGKRQVPPRSS